MVQKYKNLSVSLSEPVESRTSTVRGEKYDKRARIAMKLLLFVIISTAGNILQLTEIARNVFENET